MAKDPLVVIEQKKNVAIIYLNRPKRLNALSPEMLSALCDALDALDKDKSVLVAVLTGNQRAFAAGADIPTMAGASPMEMIQLNTRSYWLRIRNFSKPIIAAVNGYAFGGGCELAMSCDMIIAAENAQFAQPEIKLGIMPGAGGTQRLARAIGPYRAMELILTGEPITGRQAYEYGLVNRVVPAEQCLQEALELAQLISMRPTLAVLFAREAIRAGVETTIREGLEIERRNFLLLFDTHDQQEGMEAFLEKRPPAFKGE